MKLFNIGCVFLADHELNKLSTPSELWSLVNLHSSGKCTEITDDDRKRNDEALLTQGKYRSIFTLNSGYRITITTDIKNINTVIRFLDLKCSGIRVPLILYR